MIWHSNQVQNVVLFGDAAYSLMLTHLWPRTSNFKLWVLNRGLQRGLAKLYNLRTEQIGFIPREALLKRTAASKAFPQDDINFVLSMRPTLSKNFELACAVIHHLQVHYLGKNARLHVFSPKLPRKYLRPRMPKLDWISPPVLHGDKKELWIKSAPENSVLLNLSIDPLDDFNVSTAQAQEVGWPMILPMRGPYEDVEGNSTIRIPLELLRPRDARHTADQIDSIALHILLHWNTSPNKFPRPAVIESPKPMTYTEVMKLRNSIRPQLKEELRFYPHHEHIWSRKIFQVWENI